MAGFVSLLFFASGFAALVYQIAWQRTLVLFSGSDVRSATIIVAAFMTGLGLGTFLGGRVADRLSSFRNLMLFAVAELAIAVFGYFSPALYYDFLYAKLASAGLGLEARAVVLFVSLLWPTFFMGIALPVVTRALGRELQHIPKLIGGLYGANTAGGACGALLGTWVLLPVTGLVTGLRAMAALNLLVALGAVPLALWFRRRPSSSQPDRAVASNSERLSIVFWLVIVFLAGFIALSLEIVWLRLLGVMLKATTFTFGTLLGVYLATTAVGAAAGSVVVKRIRRPGEMFLIVQGAAGVLGGLSFVAFYVLLTSTNVLEELAAYFRRYGPPLRLLPDMAAFFRGGGELPIEMAVLYFALPVVLIGLSTVLIGAGIPLAQKIVHTERHRVGFRTGAVLTADVAGSTAGAVLTGLMLLNRFGSADTLRILVVVAAIFPLVGFVRSHRRPQAGRLRRIYLGCVGASLATALLLPDNTALMAAFHGAPPEAVIVGEDSSGVSVLKVAERNVQVGVFVDGVGESTLPYGGAHTVLGALPAFLHPSPRTAFVIGLGSGDTVFAMAARKAIERITCVEIVEPQLATLEDLFERWPYAGLDEVLNNPRIDLVSGRGARRYLMNHPETYDIIEADARHPETSHSGLLYSDSFFDLLLERLNPGGLVVSWAPTDRVRDTFIKIFPYVVSNDLALIGSNAPIDLDAEAVLERLRDPHAEEWFESVSIDAEALLMPYLDDVDRFGPDFDRSQLLDINSDLFPKDEFDMARPKRPITQ